MADVVEFHRQPEGSAAGAAIPNASGCWVPFPVEHKRGRPKPWECDEVQLCAQALCLEEMLGALVTEGAIFYHRPRRRTTVVFDTGLRERTTQAAERVRQLIASGTTPAAKYERKCENCSLVHLCLPKANNARRSPKTYVDDIFAVG